MNVSAKTEYACIAVLELARSYGSGEPKQIRRIAETHGIPSRFLVQILLQLKGAGLVQSTRGAAGGYQLVRDPAELTLAEVMAVIDGQPGPISSSAARQTGISQVLVEAWREVDAVQQEMLSSISFAELAQRIQGPAEQMYYI